MDSVLGHPHYLVAVEQRLAIAIIYNRKCFRPEGVVQDALEADCESLLTAKAVAVWYPFVVLACCTGV